MNVWHLYARYYNFGDHGLGFGLRNVMARYFSDRLIFKTLDCHDTTLDATTIAKANRGADLLLIGGGGLIHEFNGKWLFDLPDALIPTVNVSMIFYGLGYNAFRGEKGIGPGVMENLRNLQAKAVSFSVRNDGSRERLAALGFDMPEVPDPGFFVGSDHPRPNVLGKYVLVQLANDMLPYRGFSDEKLIAGFRDVIFFLIHQGYSVVLAPHVRADIELCSRLLNAVGNSPKVRMWDWFYYLRDGNLSKGLGYYKHAEFVIGMRGHSQIFSIGMGTPVISVVNHDKNKGLLAKLKVTPLCVEVADEDLADRLIEIICEVQLRRDRISSEYALAMDAMTESTRGYVQTLRKQVDAWGKQTGADDKDMN
jgi:polysaccharide pyruvyl transferase WcaK-like protein